MQSLPHAGSLQWSFKLAAFRDCSTGYPIGPLRTYDPTYRPHEPIGCRGKRRRSPQVRSATQAREPGVGHTELPFRRHTFRVLETATHRHMATTPDSPAYVGFEGMTLHRVIGPVPHDDVEAAIAATRLVESDDALAANGCAELGLVRAPTGPRFWANSSARAGRRNPPRRTRVATAGGDCATSFSERIGPG